MCGVWEEKCLKITLTEPKDCITVQEDIVIVMVVMLGNRLASKLIHYH